jgi:EmrB/QacA subfamily drug resistance transporter
VCIGSLSVALDNSILTAAMPRLAAVFHTDSSVISWVNLVYYITSQSLMLTLARIGDAKGRKRVFMTGLAFYGFGLLGCSVAQSAAQLIAARAIQGVGAATGYSLSMAIAVAVFPAGERGRALGILQGSNAVGLVLGPVIGGLILDLLGWRAVFFTRAPFALAGFLMAWLIVEEQKGTEESFRLDVAGSIGLFGFLSTLLLFLSFGGTRGFSDPPVLILGGAAFLLFASFFFAELKAPQPVIKLGLFKRRHFTAAASTGMLNGAAAAMMLFLVPFYLMQGLGFSGSVVGLCMALVAAPLLLITPFSGRLSDKIGSTFLCTAGMAMCCAGLLILNRFSAHPSVWSIATGIGLVGTGTAIFLPPNNSAVIGSVPRDMLGLASGVAIATRQVGVSSGIAVAGALFGNYQAHHLAGLVGSGIDMGAAKRLASIAGFGEAIIVGAAFAGLGVLTSLVRTSGRKCPTTGD